VRFTFSAEQHERLMRLQSLSPFDDLATLIDAAITRELARREAKRFGKVQTPRKSVDQANTKPTSRYIRAQVKRKVYARDNGQCRFTDQHDNRCTARDNLQYHHLRNYAWTGDHDPANLELRCHAHNQYQAELDFGPIARGRATPTREGVREPRTPYGRSRRRAGRSTHARLRGVRGVLRAKPAC
jgi:hypothetical protein